VASTGLHYGVNFYFGEGLPFDVGVEIGGLEFASFSFPDQHIRKLAVLYLCKQYANAYAETRRRFALGQQPPIRNRDLLSSGGQTPYR